MKELFSSLPIFLRLLPQGVFIYASLIFAFATDMMFAQIVPDTAHVKHVTGGITFAEGPLWHPDGFLLCSDLNGNKVLKIDPQTGQKEDYLSPSGGANGLAFDLQSNLIMCRRDERDLARLEPDSTVTTLVSLYNGLRLNSLNDLAVRSDGTVFFTDPHTSNSPPPQELNFDGVYALKPNGQLTVLDTSLSLPNGITLSPDEEKLYVNEAVTKIIYVYDIENDTTLTNKSVFTVIPGAQFVDGMKVDTTGNLLIAAFNAGVWIYSPNGQYLDSITVPGNVTNLNWGDADYQTLYITELNNVYKIRLNTTGHVVEIEHKDIPILSHFNLRQNYPNPFNPSTTIEFSLPQSAFVKLKVYNILGQEVATLLQAHKPAGQYAINFDASKLSSGIYCYTLTVNDFKQTRKMVLLR